MGEHRQIEENSLNIQNEYKRLRGLRDNGYKVLIVLVIEEKHLSTYTSLIKVKDTIPAP